MTVIYKSGRNISENGIAADSTIILSEDLVARTAGFVVKATDATGDIIGVSKTENTFAADNETLAKGEITYVTTDNDLRIRLTADATITEANIDSYFNINADQTVDVATILVTPLQVQLKEIESTTVGIFKIV